MKNFLYKLVFPECGKLYFGRAANKTRYIGNTPNEQFVGPHHNIEVQNLLDAGEFCFFLVVKEFETPELLKTAEETFLKKVWKTDDWTSRPRWLLNRNRNSIGFSVGKTNPVHQLSREQMVKSAKRMRNHPETSRKKKESWEKNRKDPNFVHKNKGKKRPDLLGKPQTEKQKSAARTAQLKTKPCPNCGREMNPGNLSQHLRSRKCFGGHRKTLNIPWDLS